MKKTLLIMMVLSLFGFVSIAGATYVHLEDWTYFDKYGTTPAEDYVDHGSGWVNFLSQGDYVTYKHNFSFLPPAKEIWGGKLRVYLVDDYFDFYYRYEYGKIVADGDKLFFGEIDYGAYGGFIDGELLEDGMLEVTVKSKKGDFWIKKSHLKIKYKPVPEPATMLLLGSGVAGLIWYRRRRKA